MKPEIKERIEQIKRGQVPEGYKKTKVGIVPNEWEVKRLRENALIVDGTHQTPRYTSNGVPFVSVENIGNINNTDKYISNEDFEKYKVKPQKNDILMTRITAGIIGNTEIIQNNNPLAYYVSLALIRVMRDYNVDFLNNFIGGFIFKKELNKRIIHTAFPKKINLNDIGECKTVIPSLSEQQKIADILSTQDKIIELKEKLIDEKQKQKKYLMQMLLTGKKRLKGFDGEWKEKSISDVFKITRGNVLATADIKTEKDEDYVYPVYSSQTKNNGLLGYYNKSLYRDAITWTTDGANAGFVAFRKGKFYCTNVCGVLLDEKGNANECIAQILNSKTKYYVSYVGNPKLMNGIMGKIKIKFPPLQEQIAIANILSTQDKEIELLQQDLEQEKEKKKALMQLLLTGIVRV